MPRDDGLLGWGGAHVAIAECDLLLMLGTDFPLSPVHAGEIDNRPDRRASRPSRTPRKSRYWLVGDVGETLKALLPRLQHGQAVTSWTRFWPFTRRLPRISKLM